MTKTEHNYCIVNRHNAELTQIGLDINKMSENWNYQKCQMKKSFTFFKNKNQSQKQRENRLFVKKIEMILVILN